VAYKLPQPPRHDGQGRVQGGFHARGIGNALTSDIESGAMIYRRSHQGHPHGCRGGFMKIMDLDRDMTLVVVQGQHHIELTGYGPIEH